MTASELIADIELKVKAMKMCHVDTKLYDILINRVHTLEKRNERLRKALEHQVKCDIGDSCACCKEIGKVARKALSDEGAKEQMSE